MSIDAPHAARSRIERLRRSGNKGFTLIELIVVVVIVGVLAAIAIPVMHDYIQDSRLSEAFHNIQSIMIAEQAYYAEYQAYTPDLEECPVLVDFPAEQQGMLWPDGGCDDWWQKLGWKPDGEIWFSYLVYTAYDDDGNKVYHPTDTDFEHPSLHDRNAWGVDWSEFPADLDGNGFLDEMDPWCVVEASADTDRDGEFVYIRTNSFNNRAYRTPNPDKNPTW